MTLLDVEELSGYWAEHPPVHLMVAAYLGVKPQPSGPSPVAGSGPRLTSGSPVADPVDAAALLRVPGMARGDIHDGLAAPIFDFEELRRRELAVLAASTPRPWQ
jgi:hypothetical protein